MKRLFYISLVWLCLCVSATVAQRPISVADIEANIDMAENSQRVVEIRSQSIGPDVAAKQLENLPVVFRTYIGNLSYDIVIISKRLTASGQQLSVAGRFIPDEKKPSRALYFSSSGVSFSAEGGFGGELKILGEILSGEKNDELSPKALALLNGASSFSEIPMPGFSDKMIMGLSAHTGMRFYCGRFEQFNLSGYVKSLGFVQQENEHGELVNAGKPLALVFSAKEVKDWEDLFIEAKVADNFHSSTFHALGFHFSGTEQALLDFSIRQNPPELPSCAGSSGLYWQGICFKAFDLRLPPLVTLKSGGALPKVTSNYLYLGAGGLVGSINKSQLVSLSEGTSGGEYPVDLSLDQVSAHFTCGNKVSAVMSEKVGTGSCDDNEKNARPQYLVTYDDQAGFTYRFKKPGSGILTKGSELEFSPQSMLRFEMPGGSIALKRKDDLSVPQLSTDAYHNSIVKGDSVRLMLEQCQGKVAWSTGEIASSILVKPTVSTVYSAVCKEEDCILIQTNTIYLTVYENLEAPLLSSQGDTKPYCAGLSSLIRSSGDCPGQTEWSVNGVAWTVPEAGGSDLIFSKKDLEKDSDFTIRARCTLNGVSGEPSNEVVQRVLALPPKPEINRSSYEQVYCSGVTLYAGNCLSGIYRWFRNDEVLSHLDGQGAVTETEAGEHKYEVKCVSYAGCESETSSAHYLKIDKCACKPTPPYIQPSTFDKVESGTEVQIHASDCAGTVTWYNSGGEFMGTGKMLTHRESGKHYYRASCRDGAGCESELSGWAIVEVVQCVFIPAAPVAHTSVYGTVEYGTVVTVSATDCSGKITWYNAGGELVGTGTSFSHRETGTHYYRATCTVGNNCSSALSNWALVSIEKCINAPTPPVVQAWPEGKVPFGTMVNIHADDCPGKISWYDESGGKTGTGKVLTVSQMGTHYYRATCTTNNECESDLSNQVIVEIGTCFESLPVPVVQVVPEGKVDYGNTVNLYASDCPFTVIWFNSSGENVGTGPVLSVRDKGLQYFRAKCSSSQDCESGWSGWSTVEIGACLNPPPKPLLASDKQGRQPTGSEIRLFASNGCPGTLEWFSHGSRQKVGEGSVLTVSRVGLSTYFAYCVGVGGCKSQKSDEISVDIEVEALCNPHLPPVGLSGRHQTDALGNDLVYLTWNYEQCVPDWVEVEKSKDGVSWQTLGSVFGSHQTYTVLPLYKGNRYWFRVKSRSNDGSVRSSPGEAIEVTIPGVPPAPQPPTVFADKKEVCPGQKANLTAHGCIEGNVLWSDGSSGPSLMTGVGQYTATCVRNGISSSSSGVVSISNLPLPAAPDLPDQAYVGETISNAGRCSTGSIKWLNSYPTTSEGLVVPDAVAFSLKAGCENVCGIATAEKTVKTNKVSIRGFKRPLWDYYYDTHLSGYADQVPIKAGARLFSNSGLSQSVNLITPRQYIILGYFDCTQSNFHEIKNGNEVVETCR